jgi:hypothetical protein
MPNDSHLSWDIHLAGIDHSTIQTILGLTLTATEPLPDKVWVWAYYVNPNFASSSKPRPVVTGVRGRARAGPDRRIAGDERSTHGDLDA